MVKYLNALRNLQENFSSFIFDGADNGFDRAIKADGLTGTRRLQVYHNSVYANKVNALIAVFPVIYRLVGDEFFRYMAREYIKAHPLVSGDLHDFGGRVTSFIQCFTPAASLVYLSDVAELEWAYHEVFHAAECNKFDLSKLQQLNEQQYDQLTFRLNPASYLLSSNYPVLDIWQANQSGISSDEGTEKGDVDLDADGSTLLIIRRNLNVEFELLTKGEYVFLYTLQQGHNFSQACGYAVEADSNCAVAHCLQKYVLENTIIDFAVN